MDEKPVAVVHETKNEAVIVGRFDTVAEAEACIVGLQYHDSTGVDDGEYGIDAPEALPSAYDEAISVLAAAEVAASLEALKGMDDDGNEIDETGLTEFVDASIYQQSDDYVKAIQEEAEKQIAAMDWSKDKAK